VLTKVPPNATHAVEPASARSAQLSTVPVSVTLPPIFDISIFPGVNHQRSTATMMSDLMLPALACGLMEIWSDTPVTPHNVRTASEAASS